MFFESILAAALLVGPDDVSSSADRDDSSPAAAGDAWLPALRPSLLALAIDAEILDPREKGFVMCQDMAGDLLMLRRRMCSLASAPQIGEANRFPDRQLVNEFMTVNRAFRNQLVARLAIDSIHQDELRIAIIETDQLYQVWDAVRDAQCDYYNVTVRRQSLDALRHLIGAEVFYSGALPPHLPVWHLPRGR